MTRDAEIVVVGGGIIGLSVAYELARRGRPVRLLERARRGAGATRASGGMLAPISEAETEPSALIEFGLDSLRRYPGFVQGVESLTGASCGLSQDGTLWAAADRDDHEELRHLAETLRLRGLGHRVLSGSEATALEPHLSGRVVSGLLIEEDGQVDPRALSHALVRAVQTLGGLTETGMVVREVRAREGRVDAVLGETDAGAPFEIGCAAAVVCAGAWTGAGEAGGVRLPVGELSLRPVKGQLVRLRGPRLIGRVLRHPRGYLVPRGDGELLIGATVEEQGFDETPTAGAVLELLRHAFRVVPGVYELELVEVSVGLRSAVADQLPVIGETEVRGLYLATGHYRNGILLAPATAQYLAEQIVNGVAPEPLRPFLPARLIGVEARRR
jgi:glycine oxidase